MGLMLGIDGKLYRNTGTSGSPTWNLIEHVSDLKIPLDIELAEVTRRSGGGWKEYLAALRDLTLQFKLAYDTGDPDYAALLAAAIGGQPIEYAVMDGPISTAGTQGWVFTGVIGKADDDQANNAARLDEFEIKPTPGSAPPSWFVAP